jgi:hypothetical protein
LIRELFWLNLKQEFFKKYAIISKKFCEEIRAKESRSKAIISLAKFNFKTGSSSKFNQFINFL